MAPESSSPLREFSESHLQVRQTETASLTASVLPRIPRDLLGNKVLI